MVSLLILVHNAEAHIEKCVRSLFAQSYADVEYVFVDDASPDGSMGIVERVLEDFPDRRAQTKIVTNPHNLGIAASRNAALDNASGEYVLFVDSDDRLDLRAVELLAAKAAQEDADMVVYDSYTVYNGMKRLRAETFPEGRQEYIRALLYRRARAAMWSKLIRRELFTAHRLRFVPGMNYGEDYYLSPMLAYHARKVVRLAEPLYYYLRHPASISYALSSAKADNVIMAADMLERFFTEGPDAEVYRPMMGMMKIMNKLVILQAGNVETWKHVEGLYDDVNYSGFGLQARQRLILWLHRHRLWTAMRAYLALARLLKRN